MAVMPTQRQSCLTGSDDEGGGMQQRRGLTGPEIPEMAWTGRLEFDLLGQSGWRIGAVEVVVRIDLVTFWWASRTLAVVDRERLRRWFRRRSDCTLAQDDIVLCASADNIAIRIDGGPIHPVPIEVVTQLRAAL
jgi:hypothetical protein